MKVQHRSWPTWLTTSAALLRPTSTPPTGLCSSQATRRHSSITASSVRAPPPPPWVLLACPPSNLTDKPSRHRASRTKALTTACTEHARVTATDRGKNGMARDAHRCGAICHEFLGTPAPCSALRKHPNRTRARFPHGLTARRVFRLVAHVLCAEEAAQPIKGCSSEIAARDSLRPRVVKANQSASGRGKFIADGARRRPRAGSRRHPQCKRSSEPVARRFAAGDRRRRTDSEWHCGTLFASVGATPPS